MIDSTDKSGGREKNIYKNSLPSISASRLSTSESARLFSWAQHVKRIEVRVIEVRIPPRAKTTSISSHTALVAQPVAAVNTSRAGL